MNKILLSFVAASVGAENLQISLPQDNQLLLTTTSVSQDHFWAYTDMFMGMMMGAYVPLNKYARNDDCYSNFFQFASEFISYHEYYDGEEFGTRKKIFLGISMLFDGWDLYGTTKICLDQWSAEQTTGWLSWYTREPKSLQVTKPTFETSQIPKAIGVLIYGIASFNSFGNGYYWYEKGYNPARCLSLLLILIISVYPDIGLITPMNAWDRYINFAQ